MPIPNKEVEERDKATPRPWIVEVHDAHGDYARIALVARGPQFITGYYVVAADEMEVRREQAIVDFKLIAYAVNERDILLARVTALKKALQRVAVIFQKGTKATTDVEWDEAYGDVEAALSDTKGDR